MSQEIIRIDNIKWWIVNGSNGTRTPVALCPQHDLRLSPVIRTYLWNGKYLNHSESKSIKLKCAEGPHELDLPREFGDEKQYVIDRIDAKVFAKMKVLNLDDEAIPVASEELKDSQYWVRAKVTESKSGIRLIVWAGDRSKKNKTQLFIEPGLKRMSFDQNDDHPTEVFAKVEATFAGDINSSIIGRGLTR